MTACGSRPRDPEAEVEAFITQVEKLTEARELGELKDLIDARYHDGHGFDKRRVVSILQIQFLKRQGIHVFSRILDLEVDDPGKNATVELLSALAGRPLTGISGLKDARADLMRFRIKLIHDGDDWLIKRVDWSRARMSDFLRAAAE